MRKDAALSLLISLLSLVSLAQEIPLENWTVPPYAATSSGGIQVMTDISGPRAFIPLQPCRVADTRGNGAPIQGGIFTNSQARNWTVTGICGIPGGADAISVNFTVVSAPATPQGGFLLAWPTGSPPANPVAIMTYGPGVTVISNAAIVPLSAGGQMTVNVSHSTHIIMDVNGYFSDTLENTGNFLELVNNAPALPTALFNNLSSVNQSSGVFGRAGSAFARPGGYVAAGILGEGRAGTLGISREFGAVGSLISGVGTEVAYGVLGHQVDLAEPAISQDRVGVFGITYSNTGGHAGVLGYAPATNPPATQTQIYGVRGVIASSHYNGAGVYGTAADSVQTNSNFFSAGVRGESAIGSGVLGVAADSGAGCGVTGYSFPSGEFGRLGCESAAGVVGTSVAAIGNTSFLEPHPSDPSVMLRYTSLHGNESGTYFRGRGKFQNGLAVIEVPEDFRIVTDPEDLTVQITPIGGMATVGVLKMDLTEIVAQSSRDLAFSYLVQGLRKAYKNSIPIAPNAKLFVPQSPEDPMPAHLSPVLRQRLISNGTYTADGKVNMETARRMGWDKMWEQRSRPIPQPEEP